MQFAVLSSLFTKLKNVPPGESGCPGSRGDQQEDAGPDASLVWRRPATDLHADAQGLLPKIPLLQHLQVAGSRRLAYLLRVLVPDPVPHLLLWSCTHRTDARPFHRLPHMLLLLLPGQNWKRNHQTLPPESQISPITAKTSFSLFNSPPYFKPLVLLPTPPLSSFPLLVAALQLNLLCVDPARVSLFSLNLPLLLSSLLFFSWDVTYS